MKEAPIIAPRANPVMFYKLKGESKKTGEPTVYLIYRKGTVAKSTGVTVKPTHFNPATGKVSMRDALHPEKNERIETVAKAFARACRDIESVGRPVTRANVEAMLAIETEEKQERAKKVDKGWGLVAEREERIDALEAELKELRSLVDGHKYILEYHLPKQQRFERILRDSQQRLAVLEAEAEEIRAYVTELQEDMGLVSSALFKEKLHEYIRIQRLNNVKESTLGNYTVIGNTVDRFNSKLKLKDIDLAFFQEFQQHLVKRGVTNNSIRGILSRIKGIYKYFADDEGLPLGFFSKFKMVKAGKDENIIFLSSQEVAELEALPLKARVHHEVRQQFLFAVETGLRRSDYNVTAANVQGSAIVLATQKTGKQVAIPLTAKARQLFEEAGHSFRLIPESQFNQTLRIICKKMPSMQAGSIKTFSIGNNEVV
ncbi:tyrosine-type recombinase/integrase [Hymenobacter glacialis]|uniref:Core-binding (CB) domain-containing protein n=1 Tax=Hymenobacter glacialis TaxID=1908236 RepID=A0A1G1T1E0_9BACT|nr:phage integrase SAM-like domain-containing protein [Hymenobacter glacialis]OGX84698.1 hypothetical protein BEN48_02895 [Hymenobacter glacialis]